MNHDFAILLGSLERYKTPTKFGFKMIEIYEDCHFGLCHKGIL